MAYCSQRGFALMECLENESGHIVWGKLLLLLNCFSSRMTLTEQQHDPRQQSRQMSSDQKCNKRP